MTSRILSAVVAMMFVLVLAAQADGNEKIRKYFADTATKVKAAQTADAKREILSSSFRTMDKALRIVGDAPSLSDADRLSIGRFTTQLQDKQDELAGRNGFARVPDAQLNAFSEYVVQDVEQAEVISISVVTLLLIIIIVILLA